VAEDGSFQVLVPANLPLQLQLLDEEGLALRSGTWIWARNHFHQGCVGCHEDPERSPPNRFVRAVADPAPQIALPPKLRRAVDFLHDVKPIVDARCVACHGANGASPDLRETIREGGAPGAANAARLERFVEPGRARASRVVWHLFGRNTSRPWDREHSAREIHPMPGGELTLTEQERRTIVEWIDLGAAWDASSAGPEGAP
jgi:mono/diheme cytochrome c family protein